MAKFKAAGSRKAPAARTNAAAIPCLLLIVLGTALAQRIEIDDRPQRAPDQALDFHGASGCPAFRHFAGRTGGGGTGKHRIFGGHPAFARVAQKVRDAVFDRRGAEHLRVAYFDQDRAFGGEQVIGSNFQRTELVGLTLVDSHEGLAAGLQDFVKQ